MDGVCTGRELVDLQLTVLCHITSWLIHDVFIFLWACSGTPGLMV